MKTKYLAYAAVALLLASCSNDEDFVPQDNLKGTPITVTAAVAELATRAGYNEENLPTAFYLNVDNTVNNNYDYSSMMKYEDGEWVSYTADGTEKRTMVWDDDMNKVTATAATYPLSDAQSLTVQSDQSTAEAVKASDHLYMAATEVNLRDTDGIIPVTLSHIMSKVKLTITLAGEFNNGEINPISNVTVTGIIPWEGTYTKPTAQYEVILVPETVASGEFEVAFNIGERTFKWTSASAVTLESGYEYTLTLNVGKDNIGDVTFSASEWGNGNGENGNIEVETE